MGKLFRASLTVAAILAGCSGKTVEGDPGATGGAPGTGGSSSGSGGSSATAGAGGSSATAGAGGSSATAGAGGSSVTAGAGGSSATAGAGGSSVTAGAGGSSVTAGAGGSSATAGAGGSSEDLDASACATGSVTFRMKPAAGQTWCARGCGSYDWLTIRPVGGAPLSWQSPCVGCSDSCVSASPVGPDWSRMSWDGTYYEYKACDAGPPWAMFCAEKHCAPPGKYIVRWSAWPMPDAACEWSGPNGGFHEETFDWPATATVSWEMGSVDGG